MNYTPEEWIAGATYEGGVYWREANGESVQIAVPAGMVLKAYGLRGSANGSITVRGEGGGHVHRAGEGDGNAQRIGDGEGYGDAYRYGEGDGDAHRSGDGPGNAHRYGIGDGWAFRTGNGSGSERDSRGLRKPQSETTPNPERTP